MREAVAGAADHREEAGGSRAFGLGQRLDPAFELRLRRALRIVVGARRLRRRAGDERLVVIEPRPRPLVDQEVVQPRAAVGRLIARQIEQHRLVARPDLAQEQARRRSSTPRRACASTRRSAADSFDRSAPMSVGAKRAVMLQQRRCIRHHDLLRPEQSEGARDSNQQRAGRVFLCHIETSLQL